MPIVEKEGNIHIEYIMPEYIKNLITDDFLKEFRSQLFRINGYYSLETFAEEGIPMNTSTSGWYAALGKACLLTHKEELFDYWRNLEWYDSDIFDGELAEMLIDRGFILGDLNKIIEQQLGIKSDSLRVCCECGKLYTDEMVLEIVNFDGNEMTSKYRCFHCDDMISSGEKHGNATDYYRMVLNDLDEYKKSNPIYNT